MNQTNQMNQQAMASTGTQPSQTPGFYRLPPEVRELIYGYVLSPGKVDMLAVHIEMTSPPWLRFLWALSRNHRYEDQDSRPKTTILRVSRLISHEALDVLYRRTEFTLTARSIDNGQLAGVGMLNLQRIRSVRLVARFHTDYPAKLDFKSPLWGPLLSNLQRLCLVVQQPRKARTHMTPITLEEELEQWTTWLDPIIGHLAANVPERTRIELDDNNDDGAGARALVEKHFGTRYVRVQTDIGDRIFRRPPPSRNTDNKRRKNWAAEPARLPPRSIQAH